MKSLREFCVTSLEQFALFLLVVTVAIVVIVAKLFHCIVFHGVYVISQGGGEVTHENRGQVGGPTVNDDGMNPCVISSAVNIYGSECTL